MPPLQMTRKVVIAVRLRAGHTPPLPRKSLPPLGGKVARNAPDEGEMSGRRPLISHLR